MNQHVVMSVQERLSAWRQTEETACEAERAVGRLCQAAADPRTRDLFLRRAGKLRVKADRQFAAVLRAVQMDEDRS